MNNIARIREELVRLNLDAVLVTDEKNQRYAAGFPFTDGAVLVGREKAFLITDSRYIEAAEKAADALVSVRFFDREQIFSRFYRVDKARSREAGGSGLGLSIVHDAVLAHGGSIEVGQNKPQGSVFTVTFPRTTSEEET